MPQHTLTRLPKSRAELEFRLTPEEARPFLDQTTQELSLHKPVRGFRPGKATYADLKVVYGEMTIWEAALERIMRSAYVRAVSAEQLEPIGAPEVTVKQLVPHQEILFTMTVTLMPVVERCMDLSQPVVTQKAKHVTDEEVERSLLDLRKLRRAESAVDRSSTKEDMVVIDLEMRKDGVPIDGGSSSNYTIYLSEPHYLHGFTDQLLGVKKGDVKSFEIEFPKEHYQKTLAESRVVCTATVKEVFELRLPEPDDAFAKGLGVESFPALRDLLRRNLQEVADRKAQEIAEIELFDALVKGSRFSEIPDLLVNEEVERMVTELTESLEERGMKLEDYLSNLKKTLDQLRSEFVSRATDRVKAALLMREIAKREQVAVTEEEIDAERDRLLKELPPQEQNARARIASPEFRETIATRVRNRKTVELLREKGVRRE